MSTASTTGRSVDAVSPKMTARAGRCIASQLAHAARRGSIDLADEAAVIDFLEARGWHQSAVEARLTEALDVARGILARARLADFIGNAVAAFLVIAVALSCSPARAALCPPTAEPDGWSSLAVAAVALVCAFAGVVVMALMCASGDAASEEERRDPENMRRS